METYYIKEGRRYIPVGYGRTPDISEGLWLVQCDKGCTSYSNLVARVSDLPNPLDLQVLARAAMLEDIVVKALNRCWGGGKSCSLANAAREVTKELYQGETKLTAGSLRRKS